MRSQRETSLRPHLFAPPNYFADPQKEGHNTKSPPPRRGAGRSIPPRSRRTAEREPYSCPPVRDFPRASRRTCQLVLVAVCRLWARGRNHANASVRLALAGYFRSRPAGHRDRRGFFDNAEGMPDLARLPSRQKKKRPKPLRVERGCSTHSTTKLSMAVGSLNGSGKRWPLCRCFQALRFR